MAKRKADAIGRLLDRLVPLTERHRHSGHDDEITDSDLEEIEELERRSRIAKVAVIACSTLLPAFNRRCRLPPVAKDRKSWEQYRRGKIEDETWWKAFRMLPEEFDQLLEWLEPLLTVNEVKAKCATPNGALSRDSR